MLNIILYIGFINLFENFKAIFIGKGDLTFLNLNNCFIKGLKNEISFIQYDGLFVENPNDLVFKE
jgi:hypothetical protein